MLKQSMNLTKALVVTSCLVAPGMALAGSYGESAVRDGAVANTARTQALVPCERLGRNIPASLAAEMNCGEARPAVAGERVRNTRGGFLGLIPANEHRPSLDNDDDDDDEVDGNEGGNGGGSDSGGDGGGTDGGGDGGGTDGGGDGGGTDGGGDGGGTDGGGDGGGTDGGGDGGGTDGGGDGGGTDGGGDGGGTDGGGDGGSGFTSKADRFDELGVTFDELPDQSDEFREDFGDFFDEVGGDGDWSDFNPRD